MVIKILISENNEILMEGLLSLFRKEPDMEVVSEAKDSTMAALLTCKLKPDVVVMDVSMSETCSLDAMKHIRNSSPNSKVIAFSTCLKKCFIEEILRAGASAYVLRECPFSKLAMAVRTVMSDEIYLCPKTASVIVDNYVRIRPRNVPANVLLTNRQREVVELLAEGKATKEIALFLSLSPKTIDACRRRVMEKLNVQNTAQLIKYAIREGLTPLEG